MNKAKQRYDSKEKNTRIHLADYLFVKQFSIGAGVSMAEALHQLIVGVKPKAEPKPEPAQMPMIPIPAFFKPKSIESIGAAYFKPKSISIDGVTRLKLKSIK